LESEFTVTTWQAFKKQVMDGQKAKEVANDLGISHNAAIIAKSRVLKRLRQEIAGLVD
jgi:RNA polymerase sigma-70 factor (ECF subfamily)